jgi:hypothetical protein
MRLLSLHTLCDHVNTNNSVYVLLGNQPKSMAVEHWNQKMACVPPSETSLERLQCPEFRLPMVQVDDECFCFID